MRTKPNTFLVATLLLLARATMAAAIDIQVNSLLDQIDDDVTDGLCHTAAGTCTLRAAVMTANRATGIVRVDIHLPAGEYLITRPPIGGNGDDGGDLNFTDAATGDPLLVLQGAGAASTKIDAQLSDRVVRVHAGARVEIAGVELRNGFVDAADANGGGCVLNAGDLTLRDATVNGCHAARGAGVRSAGSGSYLLLEGVDVYSGFASQEGGGVWISGVGRFYWTELSFNQAYHGGGISAQVGSDVRLYDSGLDLNSASSGAGGGAYVFGSLWMFRSSVFANFAATDGGGIFVGAGGEVLVSQTTVYENSAASEGGGAKVHGFLQPDLSTFHSNDAVNGGGIDVATTGVITMSESTVSSNAATTYGGGFYLHGSPTVNVYSSTLASNFADSDQDLFGDVGGVVNEGGVFNVRNSLIAGNYVLEFGAHPSDCAGVVSSFGRNLFGEVDDCTVQTGSGSWALVNNLNLIGPLASNGGPSWTHALLPGSNAIDGGDPVLGCQGPSGTFIQDQRGAPRALGARCDIGAYEAGTLFVDGFEWGIGTWSSVQEGG